MFQHMEIDYNVVFSKREVDLIFSKMIINDEILNISRMGIQF